MHNISGTIQLITDPGIKYSYLVFTPEQIKSATPLVWLHGSTPPDLKYEELEEFARRELSRVVAECQQRGALAVMPILPKLEERDDYPYTHLDCQILSRETVLKEYEGYSFYYRPDIEVVKIIQRLGSMVPGFEDKVNIGGVSAGATFANRFSILYPELVNNCIELLSGVFTYPILSKNSIRLSFPLGISDFEEIASKPFDEAEYKRVRHYIYVGVEERKGQNDIMSYEFENDPLLPELLKTLGRNPFERTEKYVAFLKEHSLPHRFEVGKNVAHSLIPGVIERVFQFMYD